MIRLGSAPYPAARRSPTPRFQRPPTPSTPAAPATPPPTAALASAPNAPATLGWSAVLLVLAATGYNAALAMMNAAGLPIGLPAVIFAEVAILALTLAAVAASGLHPGDLPAVVLLGLFLFLAALVSLLSGTVVADMARNAAIIACFVLLGARTEERFALRTFRIAAGLVLALLIVEIAWVERYAELLQPAAWFEQTRGIPPRAFDERGLFGNALGFEGRFSILQITGHRTASLFLEQVSLGNFAVVLAAYVMALWSRLSWVERAFHIALIALILVTNNSRAALAMVLAAPLVYLFAPRLNRHIVLLLLPLTLLAAWIVAGTQPPTQEDTLVGRLEYTVRTLSGLDLPTYLGARGSQAANFADAGYAYVVCTGSLIGAIALWLFVGLIVPGRTPAQKRFSLLMGLYLSTTLLVSGTSAFSIKTAALLWLLAGFVRMHRSDPSDETIFITPNTETRNR